MESKIIAIDGVDGVGKETQTRLLYDYLNGRYEKVKRLSFPFYDNDSSHLVKMYLNGEISKEAEDIGGYPASLFYASDRFISFKNTWKKYVDEGYIIIMDRYVSSNMIHQSSKFETLNEKEKFLDWEYDLEYNKLGLPKPDITIFLHMDYDIREKLIENRKNKITGTKDKDIHEVDKAYMKKTHENSLFVVKRQKWDIIKCSENGQLKNRETILGEICESIKRKGVLPNPAWITYGGTSEGGI
jgi:dTMP kinase